MAWGLLGISVLYSFGLLLWSKAVLRMHGLQEATSTSGFVWLLDSPVAFFLCQILPFMSIWYKVMPIGTAEPTVFLTSELRVLVAAGAVPFGILSLWEMARHRQIHPYLWGMVAILALVGADQDRAALIVVIVFLLVMQTYEVRLWDLLGTVTIFGQGSDTMGPDQRYSLCMNMYTWAFVCIGLLVPEAYPKVQLAFIVIPWAYNGLYMHVLARAPLGCFVPPLPPFTLPGLYWIQDKMAFLTYHGIGGAGNDAE